MTVNELDHLQAIKNQLIRKRDALRQQHQEHLKQYEASVRKLEDQIKSLSEIQGTLGGVMTNNREEEAPQMRHGKGYLTNALNRFLDESGKQEFTAAEAVHFLKGLGLEGKYLYNSTYDALKRLAGKGKLKREEGKFVVQDVQEGVSA